METKVNFAVVGAFVVVFSAALVAAVLWISSGRMASKDYVTYLAYFDESISGLNPQAPVKYKGVVIGSVRSISLDPEDPERVRLELAVERGVPIRRDTVAALSVQGLTGIAFIDLLGGTRDSPLLDAAGPEGPPVIETRPSLFRRLDAATSSLMADLAQTAQSVNDLIDAPTRASLQRTIRDLEAVAHTVAQRSEAIDAGLADAATTLDHSARASAGLAELVQQVARSAAAVERASAEVAKAGASAGRTLGAVERFGSEALPELRRLIGDARALTTSLARVAEELERNPSSLVMGKPAPPPGPGE